MSASRGSCTRYSTLNTTSHTQATTSTGTRPNFSIRGAQRKRDTSVPTMNALAQKAAAAGGAWYTFSA